ncbi:MAG TPA: hypothetical protein DDX33_07565 [Rikenellaceae bacterium]|nr:hypothetical protein [Rikenellaceae bacterium]
MRVCRAAVVAFALLSLSSCERKLQSSRQTIGLVSDILDGKYPEELSTISYASSPVRSGEIYLLGSTYYCSAFADRFEVFDKRDNVDGSRRPDMLPDFAGETLASISDDSVFGDDSLGRIQMRERVVRLALAALDTVTHISPYDLDGLRYKAPSKMIVLGEPSFAEFGGFDLDTLFRSTNCDVPIISPVDLMLKQVFEANKSRSVNLGIIANTERVSASVYASRFREAASRYCSNGAKCVIVNSFGRDSLIHRLIGQYSKDNTAPLDAIIVDDISLDIPLLKSELADIISILNEDSITLGKMIADGFLMLDSFDTAASACYDILRSNNLFTHNISLPQLVTYLPVSKPESDDRSIILIPGSYVQN